MANGQRKYEISDEEAKAVEDAYSKYGNSTLEPEKLFDLFKEWQSLKTRSLKRFVLSLSFLLTFAWVTSIDITDIKPLGINVSGADQTWFLWSLIFIHIFAFIYYLIQRSIDKNVNKAEISLFEKDLEVFLNIVDVIGKIISEKRAPSFVALVRDVKGSSGLMNMPRARKVYKAVSFFNKNLKKERTKRKWAERIEISLISLLALAALWSIVRVIS